MSSPIIKALLVNCSDDKARWLLQLLARCQRCTVNLTIEKNQSSAKVQLLQQTFDLVLVGPVQPTAFEANFFRWIQCHCQRDGNAHEPAIIALSEHNSPAAYQRWLQAGANSCLPIQPLSSTLLENTILQAIRQQADEKRLLSIAHYDPLTGLANRNLFHSRLNESIAQARRGNQNLAVMLINLDHYKAVDDNLGQGASDELLTQVASRLRNSIRETDIVARVGNSEFAVVANQLSISDDAATLAEGLLHACQVPVASELDELLVTCSIGVALFPQDGHDVLQLLQQADLALRQAKSHGGDCFHYADARLNLLHRQQQQLSVDIGHALLRDQLQLYFQPIICTDDYSICGVEALLRWQHPHRGLLTPEHFLTVTESSGLITSIGVWVLHKACKYHQLWVSQGLPPIPMAINLSSEQLHQPSLLKTVSNLILQQGFNVNYLAIELSEHDLYHCDSEAIDTLCELHDMGVHLTVDNFGKDYCSLEKLHQLPIDTIKIDRSLIQQLARSEHCTSIVETIIRMAETMHFEVIAQGVENASSIHLLEQKKCHQLQGYGIAKPLSADDFPLWYNHFSSGSEMLALH